MPDELIEEYFIFRVARLLNISPIEAGYMDPVELRRAMRFEAAENMARDKTYYDNKE